MTEDAVQDMIVADDIALIRAHAERIRAAATAAGVLYWDERTMLPQAASSWRTMQRSWSAGVAHRELLDPDVIRAVDRVCDADPTHPEACALRRDIRTAQRVPAAWSERYAAATAQAWSAWSGARTEGHTIAAYFDALAEVVACARERAELLGYEHEPYDALIGEWEPGMTGAAALGMIEDVVRATADLRATAPMMDRSPLDRPVDSQSKQRFEAAIAAALGFDPERGRIVPAQRAFCISLGPHDVRLTSRFGVTDGLQALTSTMHEVGHAIYAQSFARLGVPGLLAREASVGIDESQSRLFENHVGLHPGFLRYMLECASEHLGSVVADLDPDMWVRLWHGRAGSELRVGADELDYDAHILLRTRLERMMVNGDLDVSELREGWREQSATLLEHLPAPTDQFGVLQDVHWSIGQFGYFPCYTLGNIYAAQVMQAARRAIGTLDDQLERGDTSSLRAWLDTTVYQHGRSRSAAQIMQSIGGSGDVQALTAHIETRFARA